MSNLFEIITKFIEITGNSTTDGILLTIIGILSFLVAFGAVGMIFDAIGMYDSDLMSGCHWFIRLLVFLALSAVCIGVFKFFAWLASFQWWVYAIVFIVIICLVVISYYIKHRISKSKAQQSKPMEIIKIAGNPGMCDGPIDSKIICPRRGGQLVKRHGPYGDFYGCVNFSGKNCRYTRKFK